MRSIGATEYHFGDINTSGWIQMIEIAFSKIQKKTLVAHILAPRHGTEAVQYSKSSSGVPLCTQTSSWPWGSIIRAPKPQKWARFENFKIFKIFSFWPKNQFFGAQKAENGWRISMSSIIYWKYAVWWQKLPIYIIFFIFSHFFAFFQFFSKKWEKSKKAGSMIFIFSIFCPKLYFQKTDLVRFFRQSQSVWVQL